jgi:hypothetical protein
LERGTKSEGNQEGRRLRRGIEGGEGMSHQKKWTTERKKSMPKRVCTPQRVLQESARAREDRGKERNTGSFLGWQERKAKATKATYYQICSNLPISLPVVVFTVRRPVGSEDEGAREEMEDKSTRSSLRTTCTFSVCRA